MRRPGEETTRRHFHSHLWWSDTRCRRVSRWRGGKRWAQDWWGTGSPPAPDRRPERLHQSCCRQNPPTHTQRKRLRITSGLKQLEVISASGGCLPAACLYLQSRWRRVTPRAVYASSRYSCHQTKEISYIHRHQRGHILLVVLEVWRTFSLQRTKPSFFLVTPDSFYVAPSYIFKCVF